VPGLGSAVELVDRGGGGGEKSEGRIPSWNSII